MIATLKPSLLPKLLNLIGSFETGKLPPQCYGVVTGNFDGQGISAGVLQFNLGQGTLQPILRRLGIEGCQDKGTISKALMTKEGIEAQHEASRPYLTKAMSLATAYDLTTERGLSLMLDITVQNGSIKEEARKYMGDYWGTPVDKRMELIASCVARASNPRWTADVLSRKLTIARGYGIVHGHHYDLLEDFGISGSSSWRV